MAGAWFKEQVGPLPLGAWVAVVGGGLGIAFWSRRHPAPKVADTIEVPASADLGPIGIRDGALAGVGGDGTGATPTTPPITTNADWLRVAGATLIGHGYDPLLVTRALVKFLGGEQLSAGENAAVQLALRLVGLPPTPPQAPYDGATGPTTVTDPVTVNPPTAPPRPYTLPDQILSGGGYVNLTVPQLGGALDAAQGRGPAITTRPANIIGFDGNIYSWLSGPAVADAASRGTTLYIQPVPGVFVEAPWTPGSAGGTAFGTPYYVRAGRAADADIPKASPVFQTGVTA